MPVAEAAASAPGRAMRPTELSNVARAVHAAALYCCIWLGPDAVRCPEPDVVTRMMLMAWWLGVRDSSATDDVRPRLCRDTSGGSSAWRAPAPPPLGSRDDAAPACVVDVITAVQHAW